MKIILNVSMPSNHSANERYELDPEKDLGLTQKEWEALSNQEQFRLVNEIAFDSDYLRVEFWEEEGKADRG